VSTGNKKDQETDSKYKAALIRRNTIANHIFIRIKFRPGRKYNLIALSVKFVFSETSLIFTKSTPLNSLLTP